jgi:peptidoglycan/LPS O-acetylase OafA/YrhL
MGSPPLVQSESASVEGVARAHPVKIENRQRVSPLLKASKRIPALDGLRGVAILMVLLRHSVAGSDSSSWFWSALLRSLRLTWSGVDLFFVLSGFLIGGILLDARRSPRYFRTFYLRRAFRILPVYYLFLAFYFSRHLPIHFLPRVLADASPLSIPFFSFLTFTHNFWMAALGWFGAWAIAPTWSLAIEEQFYLTIPFLIRWLQTKSLYIALGCVLIGAPILRAILPRLINHGNFANYVLMPCRADALSMGILTALLYRNSQFRDWIAQKLWLLHGITLVALAGLLCLNFSAWDQYKGPMATGGLSCLAFFYACILLSVVCGFNPVLEKALRFKPLMLLGTVAYCTYLVHAPLMQAFRAVLRTGFNLSPGITWPIGGIFGIVAAIGIASMSWAILEKPLLAWARRYEY